jgi:uncharacterized repeat protein (TIGR03803 family)
MKIWFAPILVLGMTVTFATMAQAQKEITLYNFTGASDGYAPLGGLLLDSSGSLYGTTFFGGTVSGPCNIGCGTVFRLAQNAGTWTFNARHSFAGSPTDVGHPSGQMVSDPAGNIYGTAEYGGGLNNCCGGIFELSRSQSWAESLISIFHLNTGQSPVGLTYHGSSLYGTTTFGPAMQGNKTGFGTVYQLSRKNAVWQRAIIYAFTGGSDGYEPNGWLVFDQHGNLYGSTPNGGSGSGDIYELSHTASAWNLNVIADVGSGPMIIDQSGNLYGSLPEGGSSNCEFGCGSIVELQNTGIGWNLITLYEFTDVTDGEEPSGLVLDANGNLYGTTFLGGTGTCQFYQYSGCGTVFKLTSGNSGWQKTTLYNFTGGSDGEFPNGAPLVIDSSGNLFGATVGGATYGTPGYGTIYEIQP